MSLGSLDQSCISGLNAIGVAKEMCHILISTYLLEESSKLLDIPEH